MKASKLFSKLKLRPLCFAKPYCIATINAVAQYSARNIPNELMATYYQQRAGAGFMVTEGTQIEPRGQGYAWTPGIYSPEQIAGWCKVTEAVHAKGGIILHNFGMLGVFHIHLCNPIMHHRSRLRLLGLIVMLKSLLRPGPMRGPWLILQCHVL